MSVLANNFDCLECQRLSSKIAELQAQLVNAKLQLNQAVEAADGTSARKYNDLEELLKTQDQVLSDIRNHDRLGHTGYVAEDALTHDRIET